MSGTLILVVGPSGVGKDTLIDAARTALPHAFFPRRVITRPEEAGGEVFTGVAPAEFARRRAEGRFAYTWDAHGLSYGIPVEIEAALAQGRDVIVNASRSIIDTARTRHARLRIVVVTAGPDVLADRLSARGREDPAAIAARLARAGFAAPAGRDVTVVDNSGTRAEGIARFLAALTAPADSA